MAYTTAAVRRFLGETFSDEELKTLCFDYFRDVYDDFAAGMTRGQMIQLLIERCVRREALANLHAALVAERPDQYAKRFGAPEPAAIPAAAPEPAPPVRDNERAAAPVIAAPAVVLKRGPIEFDWVTIPAGDFLMGSDKRADKLAYDDETPQHTVHLPEYRIARVPVTVAQFAAFMAASPGYRTTAEQQGSAWSYTGSKWEDVKGADWAHPRGPKSDVRAKQDHPVTCVSWHDAIAFCKWAGVRLPTEAEWEKAGRGPSTGSGDGRIWPWGSREPNSGLCNFNMTVGDTTPVGRYPDGASPYGLLDVAGNVWEWTSSLWGKDWQKPEFGYPYDPTDGRENPNAPDAVLRVLRGGSFRNDSQGVRCASRGWGSPYSRCDYFGFRVVSPGF